MSIRTPHANWAWIRLTPSIRRCTGSHATELMSLRREIMSIVVVSWKVRLQKASMS